MKTFMTAGLILCGVLSAQTPAQERRENANREATGLAPIYRVTVTERTEGDQLSAPQRGNEDRLRRYDAHAERSRPGQGGE